MWKIIVGLLLAVSYSGAAAQSLLEPVTSTTTLIKAIGFEVTPPKGDYWFSYRQNPPGQVTFRKQDPAMKTLPNGSRHSFVVEIKAERYRDFDLRTASGLEAAVVYALYETPDHYKYGTQRFERFDWQGTECIRYTMSREQPEKLDGKRVVFRWDVEGYFCRHPTSPMIAVTGLFQERRLLDTPSMLNETLRDEAEQVLKSIRFMQIN